MKRSVLILTTMAAVLLAAMAAHSATCQLGVKGGVSIQELDGDADLTDELDSRTGFAGGAYLLADFSPSFGLRVEGLYFQKGAHAEEQGAEVTFRFDYIEFPVLAVAHVPLSETARLDFFAGPTFGFNIKAEAELSVPFLNISQSGDFDNEESFEFGVTFGAGLNFDAGPVVLGVDGRYGLGLTDITNNEDNEPEYEATKNRGFAVMGSIGFPIGQK